MTILSGWKPTLVQPSAPAAAQPKPTAASTTAEDVPFDPPALTVPSVRKHRAALEVQLAGLKAEVPAALLASVRSEPGAREAISALRRQIQDLEFEIDRNVDAVELAETQDVAAYAAWRRAVHALPPEEAIRGIGRDTCPNRCQRGVPAGCVLGGGCVGTGSSCWHPVIQADLFHIDQSGRKLSPFPTHERAAAVFGAACEKLKVKGKFAS
ncbi:hypothetical protein [Bradyrhizobium sp. STM 3566]|uniref:hypothetical protein n=1 Tax=Bradyrhizobium sp. STM 3566 TaxID=578928 RepID=UPI003890DE31